MGAPEESKAVIRRLYNELNKANADIIEELISEGFLMHSVFAPEGGREDLKVHLRGLFSAFPDIRFNIEDILADGDKVALRVASSGTHKGDYLGSAPTEKRVTFTSIEIYRIEGGRVVEKWEEADRIALLQQTGLLPPPGVKDRTR